MTIMRDFSLRLNIKNITIGFLTLLFSVSFLSLGILPSTQSHAEEQSTNVGLSIDTVLSLSVANCAGLPDANSYSVTFETMPTPTGTFASNCQTLSINTNAPGYSLLVKHRNDEPPTETTETTTGVICNTGYNYAYNGDQCKDQNNNTVCALYDPDSDEGELSSVPINCVSNYDDVVDSSASPDVVCQYLAFGGDGSCTGEITTTITTYSGNLTYQNPTTVDPIPSITPITSSITTAPTTITPNHWGFAAKGNNITLNPNTTTYPGLNFTQTYTANNQNNTYSTLPTTDTQLYNTTQIPGKTDQATFWYGTNVDTSQLAGLYSTTVTYTVIGEDVPAAVFTPCVNGPQFKGNIGNIQNLNTARLAEVGDTGIATDTRNNQEYCVGRLADNNIWMLDNMKLELTNGMTLTPQDTNVTTDTTVYFTQDGTSSGTPLTGMTGNFTTSGYMTRNGTDSGTSPNLDAWRQLTSSSVPCINNTGSYGYTYSPSSKTGCGYLYNYYTATAGSRLQSSSDEYATGSICPAGWHLPYNTSTNDWAVLNGYMAGLGTSSTDSSYYANWLPDGPFRGSYSGYYTDYLGGQGFNGRYWSARSNGAAYAHILSFYDDVYPGLSSHSKYFASSVRCTI